MASERPQRAAALKAKEGNCYTDQLELEDPYAVVGRPMGREEWRVTHWDGTSCLVNSGGPKQRRRHSSSSGRGQPRAVSGDSSKRRSPPAERCTAQSLGHAAGARQPGRQRGRGSAPLTGTAAAGAAAAAGRGDGRPAKRQRGAGQSPGDAAAAAARGAAAAAAAAAAAQADAEIEPLVAAEVGEESNGEDGSEDGTAGQPSAAAAAAAAAEEAEQDGDIEVIVISDSSDDEEARKAEWAAAEAAADAADAAEAAAAAAAERNAAGEGGGAETGQASEGASESLPPTEAYGGPGGGSGDEAEGPDGGSGDGSGGGSDEEEDEGSWEEGPALAARRRSGRGAARRMPAQGLEREDAEQPAAAAARRHGRPSGGKGKRGKAAAAEAAAAAAAEEEVEVAVEDQSDFWHLECLEEDTSQQGRLIAGWLRSNGPPGAKLWSKIRMVDEDSPGEEPQWLEYSAGDWVLTPYEDRVYDPERTEAVAQVVSFVELADGRVVVLLRWGDFYEDLVGRPPEHIPADEAMRGQNQVWLHTLNLRDPARLQEMLDEGNLAGDVIVRRCTVKHTHDILREYGGPHNSIEEYMEAEGPDAYWYSQQRPPCTLRLEDVPAPGRELQFKRIPVEQMTMIDAFAGAGFVTCGFELGGWKAVLGIELDSDAFAAYKANFPHAVPHGMWQQSLAQAVEAAKRGDPRYPKPGQVVHMHFSPPCQALSSVNSNRSVAQARAELWEHINAIVAAIKYWKPVSVSLEEVVQFLFTTMRAQPKHKGGSRSAAPAASTAADGSSDGGEDGEPSEAAEAAAAAVAREELRAWLMLQPHMIRMGYQCDWRLYAAGAYGAANTRFRVWGVFVRSGYELPPPPPPEYYVEESAMPVLGKDPRLANALGDGGNLRRLVVQPLDNLPYAPNLREAVYGVPLLPMDNPAQSFGTHTIDLREEDQQQPTSRLARWMRTAQLPRPGGDPDYRTCLHYHHREGARYQAKRAPSKPAAKQQKPLRMSWDRPLPTVCGKDDQNRAASWHPVQDRRLTVLEKKRGQAIPDQMALRGSIRQQYQQVGNAVPPPMAYAIAAALYRSLTGQEPPYKLPLLVGMEGQGRPETAREYVARQKVRGRAGERRQPAEGPAGGHGAVQQEQEQQQQEEEDEECHDEEAEGWGSGGRPGGSSSQASDGEEEEEEEEEEEGEAEAEQRRAQQRRQSGRQPQQQQQQQPQQQPQQQQQQQQPSPGRQLRLRDVVLRAPPAEPPADVILPAWPTAAEGVQQAEREEARAEEGGQQQQQLLQREQHPLAPQFEQREQQPSPPHVVPGESSGAGAAAMAAATAAGKMVAAAISSLNAAAQHAGAAAVAAAARKRAAGQPPADESPAKRQAGTGELHPVEQEQRGEQQGQAEQQPQQQQQQQQQQEQQAGLPAAEVKQEQVEQEQVEQQGQAQQAQQEAEVIDLISDEEEEEGGGAAAGAAGAAAADDAAGSEANVGAVGAAAAAAERAQQQPDDFFAVDIDSQGEAGSDAQPGSSGGGGGPRANAAAGSPAAAAPAAPAAAAAADDYGGAFSFPDDGMSPEQHGPLPAHQRFSPAQGGAAAQQWLLRTAGRLHF